MSGPTDDRLGQEPIDAAPDYGAYRGRATARPPGVGMGAVVTCSVLAAVAGGAIGAFAPRAPAISAVMDSVAPDELTSIRQTLASIDRQIGDTKERGGLVSRSEYEAMRIALGDAQKKLTTFEEGLRLMAGGPEAFDPLRRRLAAIESLPTDPAQVAPEQLARAVAAIGQRIVTLETVTSQANGFQTASVLGDPQALLARITSLQSDVKSLQAKTETAATAADLAAVSGDLKKLQAGFEDVARQAAAATRAAASAYAVSAATDAARASGPFVSAHAALASLLPNDANVQALQPLAQNGAPTAAELREEFRQLEVEIVRAARISQSGGGLLGRLQAWLAQFIVVRRVDQAAEGPAGIVERASARIAAEDLDGAVTELSRLSGPALQVAGPWLEKARVRVEIDRRIAAIRAELARAGS